MQVKGLDTSILLHALDKSSAHHARAVEIIEQAAKSHWAACICDETLSELAVVLTDPSRVAQPLSVDEIEKIIDRLTKYPQPQVLYSDPGIVKRALRLMEKYPSLKAQFPRARVAATLLSHGVRTIVTEESAAYLPIRELTVENPFETLFA